MLAWSEVAAVDFCDDASISARKQTSSAAIDSKTRRKCTDGGGGPEGMGGLVLSMSGL
jgi:hypothetical protein